ncbi:MAG: methyltransferase domain-containing protein [Acidimicrobiia bacterium]
MSHGSGHPWESGPRDLFRVRFGDDVDAFDRTRPVAPDVTFDDLTRLARLPPRSAVLEIGPGTGHATRPLAERGLRIRALETDPRLAERASRNLSRFSDVVISTTSFERWDAGRAAFDAVFACNSFHWVDPDVAFVKAAAVLHPAGHLAVLSTPVVVPGYADRFWWDVQDDWIAVGAGRVDPATKHPELVGDHGSAVEASGVFQGATVTRHPFDVSLTADEYVANLSTQSGVKQLTLKAQADLLGRVRRRIEDGGGRLTVHHLAVLTVAKRAE